MVWLEFELLRVPAKHFAKKNDPKEEALAILRAKGAASSEKVKIFRQTYSNIDAVLFLKQTSDTYLIYAWIQKHNYLILKWYAKIPAY